ncbi:MAG: hypothetical protein ACE5GK_11245 [Nitrospiria bacterium]
MPGESSKTILRLLGLIAIAGTLISCIPGPHGAYYKPSYPDDSATLERSICGGSVGPFSQLKLPTPDGYITVELRENRQDQYELWVWIDTSGFSTLQFTSNVIRLTDLVNGKEWTIEATELGLDRLSGKIPYTKVVDFSKRLPTAPEYLDDMEVWIPFSIKDFSPDAVRMHLPAIVVGSEEYRIPSLLWEADKEGKEIEGYKKSWGWWPYKEKKVKVGRFTVSAGVTGGAHGSSKIDVRLQVPELDGNIMISFPADTKWQFATNEARFEDSNSGDVRQFHFPYLLVQSSMRVAFTAPFCCSRNATMLGLPIGDARPEKLRIELPSLLINGKEFAIKPITFDLRRFELGIYPLNC